MDRADDARTAELRTLIDDMRALVRALDHRVQELDWMAGERDAPGRRRVVAEVEYVATDNPAAARQITVIHVRRPRQ